MSLLWRTATEHCLMNYPGTCHDAVLPVVALMKHVGPAHHVDRNLVDHFADRMREGEWDFDDAEEPIHLVHAPEGPLLFDGNHRVQAAHDAGVTHLPVHVKTLHGVTLPDWSKGS
jgi:hypothetical protein